MDYLSMKELCSMLSISPATGRNWLKAGRLTAQKQVNRTAYFSAEYAESVKRSLMEDDSTALKSRRNKKYISGSDICRFYVPKHSSAQTYVNSVLDHIGKDHVVLSRPQITALIAECAIQMLLHHISGALRANCLEAYLRGTLELEGYEFLIDDLIADREGALSFIRKHPGMFSIPYQPGREDVLGLLYLSTGSLGTRKAMGSYFTPAKVVETVFRKLFENNEPAGKTILDPCCGTGSFLLHLPEGIKLENIYGNDIDELSVKITRINLALRFSVTDRELLSSHITNENYLDHHFQKKFDFIVGNPPWGYEFPEGEKERLRKTYYTASAACKSIESYDIFTEQALRDLAESGVLSFVLPEAILNARTHRPVRSLLARRCTFRYLDYLGNVFSQIQCPCVILQVQSKPDMPVTDSVSESESLPAPGAESASGSKPASATVSKSVSKSVSMPPVPDRSRVTGSGKRTQSLDPAGFAGMTVHDGRREYRISRPRDITADCFSFLADDDEYSVLEKICDPQGKCFLAGNAMFALGIVTGNNKRYLSTDKTARSEPVLRGSDLLRYRCRTPENYITFQPDAFQQAASTDLYRAREKLFYRFICRQLVFAYDDRQTLSLNSCNIVIPQIRGLDVKYILAILNARPAQFYFRKSFNSVKVLRTHIEQIPIPYITQKEQEPFLRYAEMILAGHDAGKIQVLYDELDEMIAGLYNITATEYTLMRDSMAGENLFLF